MDYTPLASYKGVMPKWEATPTPTSSQHHHHHPEIEWMPCSNNSSKVEVNCEDDEQVNKSVVIEREHMFDKVVTPSDVGKLNRLVIPKQHAEKYFPLDSSNNEKGLLLNFEDRTGKPWRFRYSYWNSSQSYVMTKGWSRFVKEKKLDAGDVVSFQRGVGEVGKDKLFIDWRRRPDASAMLSHPQSASQYHHHLHHHHHTTLPASAAWTSSPTFVLRSHPYSHLQPYPYVPTQSGRGGGGGAVRDHPGTSHHLSSMSLMNVFPSHQSHPLRRGTGLGSGNTNSSGGYGFGFGNVVNPYPVTGSLLFLRSSSSSLTSTTSAATSSVLVPQSVEDQDQQQGGGSVMQMQREEGGVEPMVFESVPVVQGKAAAKRLRLFGVNMECPISHQTHDFDILSSSLASSSTPNHPSSHHHHYHYHQQQHHEQQQHTTAISLGPPSSSSSFPSSPSHHQHHLFPLQLRPFYSGAPPEKGKSYTSSSSMS